MTDSTVLANLQDRLRKVSDETIYRKIRSDDFWPEYLESVREENPGTTKKEAIEYWVEDRWTYFLEDLDNVEVSDGKLIIYRCLSVENPEMIAETLSRGTADQNYSGLGIYWTWDAAKAECYWGERDRDLFMKGSVGLKAVDPKGTVLANFQPSLGPDECEIRLFSGMPIELLRLGIPSQRGETPNWMDLKPPVMMNS